MEQTAQYLVQTEAKGANVSPTVTGGVWDYLQFRLSAQIEMGSVGQKELEM